MRYAQGRSGAEQLLRRDSGSVAEPCRSVVLDHGARTQHSVLMLHGYTNCPRQLLTLARVYHRAGHNVVVPRLPGHGYADRDARHLRECTTGTLVDLVNGAADAAAALGRELIVFGISGGGTLAALLAGRRDDVRAAVLIAPLLDPKVLPHSVVAAAARLSRDLPDVKLWWDPVRRGSLENPPTAYPAYTTRSIGAFLSLSDDVMAPTRSEPLRRLVVVTNGNDSVVDNARVGRLAERVGSGCPEVVRFEFDRSLGYGHDLLDPEGDNRAAIGEIYRELEPLIGLPDLTAALGRHQR
jgi:pimeloyl-ACP methyl ester carboxylesterase